MQILEYIDNTKVKLHKTYKISINYYGEIKLSKSLSWCDCKRKMFKFDIEFWHRLQHFVEIKKTLEANKWDEAYILKL